MSGVAISDKTANVDQADKTHCFSCMDTGSRWTWTHGHILMSPWFPTADSEDNQMQLFLCCDILWQRAASPRECSDLLFRQPDRASDGPRPQRPRATVLFHIYLQKRT